MNIRIMAAPGSFDTELAFQLRNAQFSCDACHQYDINIKEVGNLHICQPCRRRHYREQTANL